MTMDEFMLMMKSEAPDKRLNGLKSKHSESKLESRQDRNEG